MHRLELGKKVRGIWISLFFCLCVFGYTCIFNNVRIDDAYITASYAQTLGTSGTWGMHPGFPSNAATSPLNVMVLAVLVRMGMSALTAQTLLNAMLVLTVFATLLKLSRLLFASDLWAYVATTLLFVNPLLVSTLGLESHLYLALILVCCLASFLNRFAWTGFFCGLLVLARPDGVLFVAILALFVLRERRKSLVLFLAPMFSTVIAWELYSWRFLGSAVPDTYFIKRTQGGWSGTAYSRGLQLYFHSRPTPMTLSVIFLLAVPLALRLARNNDKWRRILILIGGAALLHALSYGVMKVPPYHWYYAQECAALVLLGSAGLLYGWKDVSARRPLVMAFFAFVTSASVSVGLVALYRRHATPISSNWGTVSQYRTIAAWINDHSDVRSYRINGELGVIQYYSRAEAVNEFSDRVILSHILERPSKLPFWLRRANIRFLRVANDTPAAELTSECVLGQAYQQTWTTYSAWGGNRRWCWSDSTREPPPSPAH